MKLTKLRIAIIVVAVVAVIIVASLAAAGLVAMDVWSTFATGSEKLTPGGTVTGHALVVYDPGVSGSAKDAAAKIANGLKADGYEVMLAGVKSTAASNVTGCDVIVAGGPVYAGKVGSSIYDYLDDLNVPAGTKIGAFAVGKYPDSNKPGEMFPDAASMKILLLYPEEDDISKECAGFVSELMK
jgi:flavodoxin